MSDIKQTPLIGAPKTRLDGRLKVTGQAKYAGNFNEPGLLHAVIFNSTIPCGAIKSFDLLEARAVPGVVEILTYENAPALKKPKDSMAAGTGEKFALLQSDEIFYNGQAIGAAMATETAFGGSVTEWRRRPIPLGASMPKPASN